MTPGNQWERFYDDHAPHYDRGTFTHHTVAEVDLLEEALLLKPGASILDVGCGTGRHAIELARRGYRVTGVDLSSGMLQQAMRKAKTAGVAVEWVHADAVEYVAREPHDAALCLCGAALTVVDLAADPLEHDRAILANIQASLRPGGRLVLTSPNGYRRIREVTAEDIAEGRFDPATMIQFREDNFAIGGVRRPMRYKERLYILPELVGLLEREGFAIEHTWGGTAGRWGRRPLELDETEMMVIARRASG